MTTYTCTITSNSSAERCYCVATRSAVKAAQQLGRAESGKTVTITSRSGKVLSRAIWDCSTRRYIRVCLG